MVAFDNSVHGGLRVFGGQTPPQFFVIECTHIVQLPMQVQNIGRPGTLVQIVYICVMIRTSKSFSKSTNPRWPAFGSAANNSLRRSL